MFANKRLSLLIFLFVSLLGMAMAISAVHTSQSSAEASYIQYTTATPQISTVPDLSQAPLTPPVPSVKYLEVDRHYNYHVPSDEEVASKKQELMTGKKFKDKAKKVGQQQAEQDLDSELTQNVNYLKEKNQLGSEKVPLMEIGEHSAYVSKYTYSVDNFNNCTGTIEDPVNLLFYDTAQLSKVAGLMMTYGGWEVSPYTEWPLKENDQCAYTSSFYPWDGVISKMTPNQLHMIKEYSNPRGGISERDHMRMWDGGLTPDSVGFWTLGAVHHEWIDYSPPLGFRHCLNPYEPEGSSFDYAEGQVWNAALGRYNRHFSDFQNKFKPDGSSWYTCGNTVNHDGKGVSIDIPSDTLYPGQYLAPGQWRQSADRRFWFTYQNDGNLVLYQSGVGAIWHINRFNYPTGYTAMLNRPGFPGGSIF
ncbi:MAG: hypothetical protein M1539_00365 [Actinobacteria bacterium]|nr:hypothetical protein [Actinomycetota bacterium]MCL5882430.1 hypothetical protein [Actinomycetota bacterium]